MDIIHYEPMNNKIYRCIDENNEFRFLDYFYYTNGLGGCPAKHIDRVLDLFNEYKKEMSVREAKFMAIYVHCKQLEDRLENI